MVEHPNLRLQNISLYNSHLLGLTLANYDPQAKSDPLLDFVNKVLLNAVTPNFLYKVRLPSCYNGRLKQL